MNTSASRNISATASLPTQPATLVRGAVSKQGEVDVPAQALSQNGAHDKARQSLPQQSATQPSLTHLLHHQEAERISILFVDDEPAITSLMEMACKRLNYEFTHAADAEEALEKFRQGEFQIVVTDIGLPGVDGLELMCLIKAEKPEVDVIIVTGYIDNYTYADVVRNGASDFMAKPFAINEFQAKVERVVRERQLIAELERKTVLLNELSITDELTNLYNYRHFNNQLHREMSRARRQDTQLSLLVIDLDKFKAYNDQHGHRAGDELLHAIGKHLPTLVRKDVDMVFRYGGDEFAIILIQTSPEQATRIAQKILHACAEAFPLTPFSIGGAQFNGHQTVDELFSAADQAMYQAKSAGGGCVRMIF